MRNEYMELIVSKFGEPTQQYPAAEQTLEKYHGIKPHCAYLFYNKAGTRLKVLIHDGLGVWLCSRTLDDSKFHGLSERLIRHHSQSNQNTGFTINQQQFNALISGLAWHNLGKEILTPVI